jgi:Undecaprenyl-phosphate galactose phosphotransferase WbaP
MSFTLALSDGFSLLLAGVLAIALYQVFGSRLNLSFYLNLAPLALIFLGIYWARGLYPAVGLGVVEELRRLTLYTSVIFLALASFSFLLKAPTIFSRLTFFLDWGLALVLVPLNRSFTRALLARADLWGESVAVIGPLQPALAIVEGLRCQRKNGRRPVVIFSEDDLPQHLASPVPVFPVSRRAEFCARYPLRSALVFYADFTHINAVREKYHDSFERVQLISNEEDGLSLSGVSVSEFGGVLSLEIHHSLMDRWAQLQKRLVDILGASLGLLLLTPFFLLIALLIELDSPGRVFYRQSRLGKGGNAFTLLKFRTMHIDADAVLSATLARDPLLKAEWEQYQKLKRDPRITRVGALLRRFSLDELPQLWNVLIGEMSLVGPRPIMLSQNRVYGSNLAHYTRVVPGITGMWQINGRNHTSFARRAELDYYYVLNWSFWLDIYILVRTIWVVLSRDGAC